MTLAGEGDVSHQLCGLEHKLFILFDVGQLSKKDVKLLARGFVDSLGILVGTYFLKSNLYIY